MSPSWIWWAPLGAATLHIVEEFVYPGGFAAWDRMYRPHIAKSITKRLHIVMNAILIAVALLLPLSSRTPSSVATWLTLAALLFGNAIFHLVGTIRTQRYSPGLVTGLVLYVPMAVLGYGHFLSTKEASKGTAVVAVLLGCSYQLWATMMHKARARTATALVALGLLCGPSCGKATVEAPFEFPRSQIVLQAQLQGKTTTSCLLDTGTNPSAVDAKLAEQLGLSITGPGGKADGVGSGDVEVKPTSFDVSVGGSKRSRIEALTIDMGPLSKRIGRPIGCILGQSWLKTQVVQIDYPRRVLRIAPEASPADASRCREMPMRFWLEDDAMPLVEVEVMGDSYPVTLDTGSSGTLKLYLKNEPPEGFEVDPTAQKVAGFRGEASVLTAKVASLTFGPVSLQDLKITLGDPNLGEPSGARMGNLGNGVLQHAVLTLDYPSRRVTVCAEVP